MVSFKVTWGLVHKKIANLRLRHGLREVYVCWQTALLRVQESSRRHSQLRSVASVRKLHF